MIMPIVALLPGFTSPSRTNPQVLHNRGEVNSLEEDSSIVTVVLNGALYHNKVKLIDCTTCDNFFSID